MVAPLSVADSQSMTSEVEVVLAESLVGVLGALGYS